MKKFKDFINEPSFIRSSMFIVFNAFLLYVLYFIIKNFDHIAITAGGFIGELLAALSPLFIGLLIAYLLNPLVTMIDTRFINRALIKPELPEDKIKRRESLSRILSILLTFVLALAAIAAIIYGFAVMILGQFVFNDFTAMAGRVFDQFLNYENELKNWISSSFPEGFLSDKLMEFAGLIIAWISENFSAASAFTAVSGAVGSIVNFVIGMIISIYLMKDKDFFLNMWNRFLDLVFPAKVNGMISETLREINGVLSLFIRGALLDAVFVAILASLGLSILGLDFAVFIGVFAGLANVIPYFGPVLGMIPAFIMGTLTDSLLQGILAVVILLVVQQIDSNIIYPKVVGSSTGLHPLMVLLAVSVFGYFGGILGMLIAVPAAGIIQIFVRKWICRRESKLNIKKEQSTE